MVSLDGNKYITITFDDINNGVGLSLPIQIVITEKNISNI